jgi:hypothetical protein
MRVGAGAHLEVVVRAAETAASARRAASEDEMPLLPSNGDDDLLALVDVDREANALPHAVDGSSASKNRW